MKLYSCCEHCMRDIHRDDEWDAHETPCFKPRCREGNRVTGVEVAGVTTTNTPTENHPSLFTRME